MKVTTRSKASILARLNALSANLHARRNTFVREATSGSPSAAGSELSDGVIAIAADLDTFIKTIEKEVEEECDPLLFYDQKTFEVTAQQAREEVVKRFAHFPMSAALIDMFLMFFELKLQFNSSFLALREKCGAEDRSKNNPSHYNTNGDPDKP